jgi:hypothetical protein
MLLSRQRKNVVTGTITVFGNEFYQLGDVVYVVDRQLLYYVHQVKHSISYEGQFQTTLDLKYGHAPGDYIPTPLDVIGKSMLTKSGAQNAYRVRRHSAEGETHLASIRFPNDSTDLFGGDHGLDNFKKLKQAASIAVPELDSTDPVNSQRVYIMTFTDSSSHDAQMSAVQDWFRNPKKPGSSGNSIGVNLTASNVKEMRNMKISSSKLLKTQNLPQCLPDTDLSKTEEDLIKRGFVANEKSYALDRTLLNIVEVRLRRPPAGGWTD